MCKDLCNTVVLFIRENNEKQPTADQLGIG